MAWVLVQLGRRSCPLLFYLFAGKNQELSQTPLATFFPMTLQGTVVILYSSIGDLTFTVNSHCECLILCLMDMLVFRDMKVFLMESISNYIKKGIN